MKISGNVMKVPADVTDTIHILPRVESASGTIKVQLKRKLRYKSSALLLNVRPHKVFQAAKWLSLNSSLYKEEGITFNEEWKLNDSTEDFQECSEKDNISINSQSINTENQKCTSDDGAEIVAGVTGTMLMATNFIEDNECEHILDIAPGEGSRPQSIFKDKFCEKLAHPDIFLGEP